MHFLSPEGGEPKYSIRVVPKPTEVLSKGGTNVRLVLIILVENADTYAYFEVGMKLTEVLNKGGTNVKMNVKIHENPYVTIEHR